jgi:cyclohexanone monooxygenase
VTEHVRIAIIGAGPGGLCTAKRLLDEGEHDFVLIERTDDVGGTWNRNRYPGCECDVPSALYSFTFEFKPDWSKPYGTQPEILEYMRGIADKYGIRRYCRFGTAVHSATWNGSTARWELELADGERLDADFVVSAVGMFNGLAFPAIDGLDTFAGAMWHSGRWNWDYDIAGARIAVIGSAASAVQLVPEIIKTAGQVYLFQRSANWVLPKIDKVYSERELEAFRADPSPLLAFRAEVERNMNEGMVFDDERVIAEREKAGLAAIDVVRDPETRRKLVPTHPYGCKRPLFSNVYYPAFNEPNLELVTDHIVGIEPDAVVTAGGNRRVVDVIVLATGYETTKYASVVDFVGRDGVHIDVAWSDGAVANLGVTTAGFPNLFMLYGPNTNNGSILTMIEYQVDHFLAHLRVLEQQRAAWVDVRPATMERSNADIQAAIARVRVWQAECNGYYRSRSGRVVTQWPFSMLEFQRRTATIDPDDYEYGIAAPV